MKPLKGDATSVQPVASCEENISWSNQRMISVAINSHRPQLRCKPVAGGRQPISFSYELWVLGRWIPINFEDAKWFVDGDVTARAITKQNSPHPEVV